MSIQTLFQPNSLDIFCNDLNAQNITFSGSSVGSLTVGPPGPLSTVDAQILASNNNVTITQPYQFSNAVGPNANEALFSIINTDAITSINTATQLLIDTPNSTTGAGGNNFVTCHNGNYGVSPLGDVCVIGSDGGITCLGSINTSTDVNSLGNISGFDVAALNNCNVSGNVNCTGTVTCTDGNVTNDLIVGNNCTVGGVLTIANLTATNLIGSATVQSPGANGFSANGGNVYGPLTLATAVQGNNDFTGNIASLDLLTAMNTIQIYNPVPIGSASLTAPAALAVSSFDPIPTTFTGNRGPNIAFVAPGGGDGIELSLAAPGFAFVLVYISATLKTQAPAALAGNVGIRVISSMGVSPNNAICANSTVCSDSTSNPGPGFISQIVSTSMYYRATPTEVFTIEGFCGGGPVSGSVSFDISWIGGIN